MLDVHGRTGSPHGIGISVRRVLCLGLVAGYIDAIGFFDLHGIYAAAMTGATVQLGISFALEQWPHFAIAGGTVGTFFCGGLVSSVIRRRLSNPAWELVIMACLVLAAQAIRSCVPSPVGAELPLLAAAMAMQGETISRFSGVPVQTIVVTNNLLKCADAIVGRYLPRSGRWRGTGSGARSSRADIVLPGCAWLACAIGAGSGVLANLHMTLPFVIPAAVLVLTTADLLLAGLGGDARPATIEAT